MSSEGNEIILSGNGHDGGVVGPDTGQSAYMRQEQAGESMGWSQGLLEQHHVVGRRTGCSNIWR